MNRSFVIGIAGGSASGKTTLCEALEKALAGLRVATIHMDGYFKAENQRPWSRSPITGTMYVDDNHPDTMDLPRLRADLRAMAENGLYEVILVEGLLTLWDEEICRALDLRLFVDCRADERIVRRLRRNMDWGLGFDQIADVYLDLVRYRHDEYVEPSRWKADFVLNGSGPPDRALSVIAGHVRSRFPAGPSGNRMGAEDK